MAGSGGAWKVAYADFVTAMMAFFMVMWITGQGQETKEAIAGYFQDPWGTSADLAAPSSLMPNEMHGQSPAMSVPQHASPGPKPGAADSDPTENETQKNSK